jgi:hypothetical protein
MSNAFDGVGEEGYRQPTFRAAIGAFVLIMVAVALVWLVWSNLVYEPQQPAEQISAPPQVQRIDYGNPGTFM